MTRDQSIFFFATFAVVAGIAVFWFYHDRSAAPGSGAASSSPIIIVPELLTQPAPETSAPPSSLPQKTFSQKPGIEVQYLNTTFNFFFDMPDGFLSQEYQTDVPGAQAVLIYNQSGDGLEVLIIPSRESGTLTLAEIASDDPTVKPSHVEAAILSSGVHGLVFDSATSVWDGPARELWFLYKGNRYELAAPATDAALIDFVQKSWKWGR